MNKDFIKFKENTNEIVTSLSKQYSNAIEDMKVQVDHIMFKQN